MRNNDALVTASDIATMVDQNLLKYSAQLNAANDKCVTNEEAAASLYIDTSRLLAENVSGKKRLSPYQCFVAKTAQAVGNSIFVYMDQVGNPYLNSDVFASYNGNPIRLDPDGGLDGLFFGNQTSPNIAGTVQVGNVLNIGVHAGLPNPDGYGGWGWEADGYIVYERWENGSLVYRYNKYKAQSLSASNFETFTFNTLIQPGINYYFKGYSVVSHRIKTSYHEIAPSTACSGVSDCNNIEWVEISTPINL